MQNPSDIRPNRLASEKSPYLLQHAHNPVDWYPWGEEAFRAAEIQGKPIFLSVGYSTCHWCHVMERESFEDPEIADLLNRYFVSIKVDREEHPDIDALYMSAVMSMIGHGGWPMTVFLTPEGEPFYGGTYFPPETRSGMMGMRQLLPAVAAAWEKGRENLVEQAKRLTEQLKPQPAQNRSEGDIATLLDAAYRQAEGSFDSANGGFGNAPKFPSPHILSFLMRYAHRNPGSNALQRVAKTLDAMIDGGIHDHLGGGFHRYSTDAEWLAPHFEKMLYDQALMLRVLAEAYQMVGEARYKEAAEGVIDYVLRDLSHPEGGFYSAEDADSEGREGRYYVWTPEEFRHLLGDDADWAAGVYDVTEEGNFEEGSILNRIRSRIKAEPASEDALRLASIKERLLAGRAQRTRPHLDDKVLTSWNGLMIGALAYAGFVFDNKAAVEAAQRADAFIRRNLSTPEGALLRRYRDGDSRYAGTLEDYAFYAWGLLDLYHATGEAQLLCRILEMMQNMREAFWDADGGAFYLRSKRDAALIVALKECYDGAMPSGNSAAALLWVRMAHLTGDQTLLEESRTLLRVIGAIGFRGPLGYAQFLIAADWWLGPRREVVLEGDKEDADAIGMRRVVAETFLPRTAVLYRWTTEAEVLDRVAPQAAARRIAEKARAFVCEGFHCRLPAESAPDLRGQLETMAHAN